MNEHFPPVEIDRSNAHPDVVFFQDRLTRFTIAVEAESGEMIGASAMDEPAVLNRVAYAVRVWRDRRMAQYRKARRENET